ncbi:cob(I)yrinic acid a,c-diamide adenosyltransferase [Pirellulales bacterium]|nr:cob(I)yrinic acid a,c-diamide adenosyltransferase [Pirellulales bacterium]
MKIYTRTGDAGETALLGGARVRKHHQRLVACGTIDELNASIGQVRAFAVPDDVDGILERIQHELFALGAEIAAPSPDARRIPLLAPRHVAQLEADIDEFDGRLPELTAFILPAGPLAAVSLHLARCTCRRGEREIVAVSDADGCREIVLQYVNRLSDLLFVLARATAHAAGAAETPWDQAR